MHRNTGIRRKHKQTHTNKSQRRRNRRSHIRRGFRQGDKAGCGAAHPRGEDKHQPTDRRNSYHPQSLMCHPTCLKFFFLWFFFRPRTLFFLEHLLQVFCDLIFSNRMLAKICALAGLAVASAFAPAALPGRVTTRGEHWHMRVERFRAPSAAAGGSVAKTHLCGPSQDG